MKTKFKEIITEENFILNSKIFDLGRSAEIIANVAQEKLKDDGEFAKMNCSNIVNWMGEIAKQAQNALDLSMGK